MIIPSRPYLQGGISVQVGLATYISNMKAWVWHNALSGPAMIPAYPMRQATLAPRFANDAKMMKVFGTVRKRLKAANAIRMSRTPVTESEAPTLSKMTMVLT